MQQPSLFLLPVGKLLPDVDGDLKINVQDVVDQHLDYLAFVLLKVLVNLLNLLLSLLLEVLFELFILFLNDGCITLSCNCLYYCSFFSLKFSISCSAAALASFSFLYLR